MLFSRAVVAAFAFSFFLVGCGGSVKRTDDAPTAVASGISKFTTVTVALSDEARKALVDNIKFDVDQFSAKIRNRLDVAQLMDKGAAHSLAVTITGVRVRGSFSAVMFGVLAGADSVEGDVAVLDKSGKVVRTFKVSATYAFGGLAGGIDSVRLGYLYDKFSDLTAAEFAPAK